MCKTNEQSIEQLMNKSQVSFGTSGARGLVLNMTDQVCYVYTLGFIQYLEQTQQINKQSINSIALAGDLRESTNDILNACAKAIIDKGYQVVNCGLVPTPAVALYGLQNNCPAIMVTGSHIPDDRNGIKFYKLSGEILKEDEAAIQYQSIAWDDSLFTSMGKFSQQENYLPELNKQAMDAYKKRYLDIFSEQDLQGLKIGVYQHSGVARDIIPELLEKLGAEVVKLGFSNQFIPVDTEAVREEDCRLAKQWIEEYQLDAIVSTDGDADRPLISDEKGNWLRGDIVGFLCAHYLQIDHLVTPISSNTSVEKCQWFVDVKRTRIGSPYVIEAMNHYTDDHYSAVAGYEANGGFLLATPIRVNEHLLTALPTRDAVIVLLAVLHSSVKNNQSVSQLLAPLMTRYTVSDRLKDFAQEKSQFILQRYNSSNTALNIKQIENDFPQWGSIESINTIDGIRIYCLNGDIIHFRPSGNAPEFRCYSEADNLQHAEKINQQALQTIVSIVSMKI